MQATLLIVDSIATNRVALKVKLAAAWYDVYTACSGEEALALIPDLLPNLVLANSQLPDMDIASFSARMTARLGQSTPPILAQTEDETSHEDLLRAGVEDVLPLPVDDQLLIARIRSVLRSTATEAEWRLRDGTSRALGFAEPVQNFERPIPIALLQSREACQRCVDPAELRDQHKLNILRLGINEAFRELDETSSASVILIDVPEGDPNTALSVLSDLRANARTRHKAILVAAPKARSDLAARALDLGADEVTIGSLAASELFLRAHRLHKRREIQDSLRATVINGAEAAIRDPLTGLYNRRYAVPHLERIAEQSRQSGRPYAVMIADLDHFKRINDWYGHDVGDEVLKECAKRMQDHIRAIDLVARIGGEEFLIVLPATGRSEARQTALRLCQRISQEPVTFSDRNLSIDVTVSIGLALSTGVTAEAAAGLAPATSPDSLLSRADRALYRAKEMGRNRFMFERSAA